MENPKNVSFFYKIFSLLSVVRGYNILVLVVAQYLASIFIFSPQKSIRHVVLNWDLFFVVLASICVVAGGYIINNFYDSKADKINRPYKSGLDSFVSQETKLTLYFVLNFIGVIVAYLVSLESGLVLFRVYLRNLALFS